MVSKTNNHNILLSQITPVEIISALARQYHDGGIKLPILQSYRGLVTYHIESQYQIISLSNTIVNRALDLHETSHLRAYDSIQLASALELRTRLHQQELSFTFVAGDVRLLNAATSEGLSVENPNDYD